MKEDQASSTAFTVVQGVLFTARHSRHGHLVSAEHAAECERILSNTDEGQKRLKQLASPLYRAILPLLEKMLIPGISRHYVLRKQFIEEASVKLLDNNDISQVVVLGAGFDSLAWRLSAKYADVTFIEIDHPSTSLVKQQALAAEAGNRPNAHFHAVDLSKESLSDVLTGLSFYRRDLPTLFICEGVLMYLPEAAIRILLSSLVELTDAPPHFIFSALEPMSSAQNNTRWLLKKYLTLAGEQLSWELPRSEIEQFLRSSHYEILDSADGLELNRRYLPDATPSSIHQGEYLVHARALHNPD